MNFEQGTLIIYSSPDAEDPWTPVKAVDVPAWIKDDPEVLGRLVDGEAANNNEPGALWYRAERLRSEADERALIAAQFKRDRRRLRDMNNRPIEPVVVH